MVNVRAGRDYTPEELRDKSRKNGGVRVDGLRQKELSLKLRASRGDADYNKEKARAAAYDAGCISPLPRDKDGNLSYIPDDSIRPDKMEVIHRLTDGARMRSNDDKLAREFKRVGVRFSDYENIGHDMPNDKPSGPKYAKRRKDSPFKRAGKAVASVVIIRKG